MMNAMPKLEDDLEDALGAVDVLATDFLARYRNGDRPSVQEYVLRHPDLGEQIRELFPLVLSVEKVKVDQQQAVDGSATLAGKVLSQLGDFSLLREVGRGGAGIVYEAEQQSLGRRVAVKILPKQSLLDDEALSRFHREARTAAAMHHSNIVPIFGTGESEGTHYIVMQLVRGKALDQQVAENELPFACEEVARIGIQVADALAYAHDAGVLHRDIKPGNILVDGDGVAQIADFGLARSTADDPTATHTLSGSLRYMAPERFSGVSDHRSDVYSLGLTLYEMLAGRPAFKETDLQQLMSAITRNPPATLRTLRPDIPADLETIVMKAITSDTEHRYQTAAAFREDLQRFLADEPIHARRTSLAGRCVRWCRRNPKLAVSTSVAVMALVMATVASSAAYLMTSAANKKTQAALVTSEQTLDVALQSLDGVVDVVSISPSLLSLSLNEETGGESNASESTLRRDVPPSSSPQSAAILERIQPLYERLSRQAPTRPDIMLQMVDASIQLARIQHQLGRTTTATQTLKGSLDLINDRAAEAQVTVADQQLRLSRLHNEIGRFHTAELEFEKADLSYLAAVEAVSDQPPTHHAAHLELAQAHLMFGYLPPGRRREESLDEEQQAERRAHIATAMEITSRLADTDVSQDRIRTIQAKSLLAMSRLTTDPGQKRNHFTDAVTILEDQLNITPNNASVRFELVLALADVEILRGRSRRTSKAIGNRLQKAQDVLQPLRLSYPDTVAYSITEVHLRHRLSSIATFDRRWQDAELQLNEAIRIQSLLVNAQPDSMTHRCWRALLYRNLSETARSLGDEAAAASAIERAKADVASLPVSAAKHPFAVRTRRIITELAEKP